DQIGAKAIHLPHRLDAHHGVAAAHLRIPEREAFPFDVAEQVVNGLFGVPLPQAPANGCDVRTAVEKAGGHIHPTGDHFAIAVDEKDVSEVWTDTHEVPEALVPRARR